MTFVAIQAGGGWDTHADNWKKLKLTLLPTLDEGLAALFVGLEQKGLLASTCVLVTGEFGRTPKINDNAGRDHHPAVFSCVLAGAGVRGGVVHGASDERGFSPESGAVSVADFNSTVAAAAGLPHEREFLAPNGRPFRIGGGGTPVREVLA